MSVIVINPQFLYNIGKIRGLMAQLAFNFSLPKKQEARKSGKEKRKEGVDIIKDFIEYARSQGSQGCDKYYILLSQMIKRNILGTKDNREEANVFDLSALAIADSIVGTTLKEGMEQGLPYKTIFQNAKKKIEDLANSIGKK
jgi:hypothetical protein